MEFRWNDWNAEHLARHGVRPLEAQGVVMRAKPPYPAYRGDGKYLVWGRGQGGRWIQVVFVLDEDKAVFIIHARTLTDAEKRRLRWRT